MAGGSAPMRMSRRMPPPRAVTMPSVSIPMMSSFAASRPVIAPLSANANVPVRSNASSSGGSVMTASMPHCLAGYDPECGASQARAAAVRASVPVRRVGCSGGRNFGEWFAGRSSTCPFFSAVRYVCGSVPPMAQ